MSPTSQTGTSTMVEEAVCVFDTVFFGTLFTGLAAAKSVVSSMIQINNPMSFVFIFFTLVLFTNQPVYYKDISYINLVIIFLVLRLFVLED